MLFFYGNPLVIKNEVRQRFEKLKGRLPELCSIHQQTFYVAKVSDRRIKPRLTAFLNAHQKPLKKRKSQGLWVLPKSSGYSTWSLKATQLARECGLTGVKKLEKGSFFLIEMNSRKKIPLEYFDSVLYDFKYEKVFPDLKSEESLFEELSPLTLCEVDLKSIGNTSLYDIYQRYGFDLNQSALKKLSDFFQEAKRHPTAAELIMCARVYAAKKDKLSAYSLNEEAQIEDAQLLAHHHAVVAFEGQKTYPLYPEYIENADAHEKSKLVGARQPASFRLLSSKKGFFPYQRHYETHHPVVSVNVGEGEQVVSKVLSEDLRCLQSIGQGGVFQSNFQCLSVDKEKNILNQCIEGFSFCNNLGYPTLAGYVRTMDLKLKEYPSQIKHAYQKPVVHVGNVGHLHERSLESFDLLPGAAFVLIGSPLMKTYNEIDPEMQRRSQAVVNACTALKKDQPILAISNAGTQGLALGILNLLSYAEKPVGATLYFQSIPTAGVELSPVEVWAHSLHSGYLLLVEAQSIPLLTQIAEREACPCVEIGHVTELERICLEDKRFGNRLVDLPLDLLNHLSPEKDKPSKNPFKSIRTKAFKPGSLPLKTLVRKVLSLPDVAAKIYLINQIDRTAGGMVARDQMIGPWQVPVSDVAVTACDFRSYHGYAQALGERARLSLIDPILSAKTAIAEAVTNIAGTAIAKLSDIQISLVCSASGDYEGVRGMIQQAVSDFCLELGISHPIYINKTIDSPRLEKNGKNSRFIPPLSVVASAFAKVIDVRKTLTPQLTVDEEPTDIIIVALADNSYELGGSSLAYVCGEIGSKAPSIDPSALEHFFYVIQILNKDDLLLAYHDCSDGGILITLLEMAFAGNTGLELNLDVFEKNKIAALFSEGAGAAIQIRRSDRDTVLGLFEREALKGRAKLIGTTHPDRIRLKSQKKVLYSWNKEELQNLWEGTSTEYQPKSQALPLSEELTFEPNDNIILPYINHTPPMVAILRAPGTFGHFEMAAAFEHAGFECIDVHLTDILKREDTLQDYVGLALCAGFSYGDVLGAGQAFARQILSNPEVTAIFRQFFNRKETFTFGAGNGCQMLSCLRDIIPGASNWPLFEQNNSQKFEAHFASVRVEASPSIFFKGMEGSKLIVPVAHKTGKAIFKTARQMRKAEKKRAITLRYVAHQGKPTEAYPANPNGSVGGITGLTSEDGRVCLMMPHPERAFRDIQPIWRKHYTQADASWLRLFRNARVFVS